MGRPRKNTAQKEAIGDGHKPHRAAHIQPSPIVDDIQAPEWLNDSAKAVFVPLSEMLRKNKILTANDLHAIERYSIAYVEWRTAVTRLSEDGYTQVTNQGIEIASPWVAIAAAADKKLHGLSIKLGLTPKDRESISIPKTPDGHILSAQQKFIERIKQK